jgi:prepilin-type processing-associated H-X9-DG protein
MPNLNWAAMIGFYQTAPGGVMGPYRATPTGGSAPSQSNWIFQLPSESATQCNPFLAQTPHAGQAINCAMGDGSVKTVSHGTTTWDVALWPAPNAASGVVGGDLPLDSDWSG